MWLQRFSFLSTHYPLCGYKRLTSDLIDLDCIISLQVHNADRSRTFKVISDYIPAQACNVGLKRKSRKCISENPTASLPANKVFR